MSELQPSVYAFEPDLPPPVFRGAPLPVREFQLATMMDDSLFLRSDELPAVLRKTGNETLADAVREIEANDEPIAVRDGRVIALIAAMTEENLAEPSTLGKWQLAPHMGMLHAVAVALSTGLPVSSGALSAAAAFHHEYRERESPEGDPYASPVSDAVVEAIKHTMSGYGSMDFISGEKGTGRYLAYYLYDIDRVLYELPVAPEMLENYAGDAEATDLVAAYKHLMRQILTTREALLAREPELREHLEKVYERVEGTARMSGRFGIRLKG